MRPKQAFEVRTGYLTILEKYIALSNADYLSECGFRREFLKARKTTFTQDRIQC